MNEVTKLKANHTNYKYNLSIEGDYETATKELILNLLLNCNDANSVLEYIKDEINKPMLCSLSTEKVIEDAEPYLDISNQ